MVSDVLKQAVDVGTLSLTKLDAELSEAETTAAYAHRPRDGARQRDWLPPRSHRRIDANKQTLAARAQQLDDELVCALTTQAVPLFGGTRTDPHGPAQRRVDGKMAGLRRLNAEMATQQVRLQTMDEVDVDALVPTTTAQRQYATAP
jgi:hypothetical protein